MHVKCGHGVVDGVGASFPADCLAVGLEPLAWPASLGWWRPCLPLLVQSQLWVLGLPTRWVPGHLRGGSIRAGSGLSMLISSDDGHCCKSSSVSQLPPLFMNTCAQSCPTLCDPMDGSLPASSVHGDSPGKSTGVGCHVLLQGILLIQGLNSHLLWLLRWQEDSLPLNHLGSHPSFGSWNRKTCPWL